MTNIVYLDERRPQAAKSVLVPALGDRMPVTRYLEDLSEKTGELAHDWLFQAVSPAMKRAMLAERGITVAETALA